LNISCQDVTNLVVEHHSRPQDLDDGDLRNRLDRFTDYVRKTVPIASIWLDEFDLDEDRVADYEKRYRATGTYPPIVFDEVDGSVIDGLHRVNALHLCGLVEIDAFVGTAEYLDCDWVSVSDENEKDEKDGDDANVVIDDEESVSVSIQRRVLARSIP
jgi:hypothetical protein